MKVGLANCQSVRNKTDEIVDFTTDNDVDIMTFTETWLKDDGSDERTIGDLTPSGYCFKHVPRSGRLGGGVGVLYKRPLALIKLTDHRCKSFESFKICFTANGEPIRIVVLYRLHPKKKTGITNALFFEEFTTLVDSLVTKLLMMGDVNIWRCCV